MEENKQRQSPFEHAISLLTMIRNERDELAERLRGSDTTLQQKTIIDLMDEKDKMAKALKKYGQHNLTCNWSRLGADPCTCGLKEAFANIGEKLE